MAPEEMVSSQRRSHAARPLRHCSACRPESQQSVVETAPVPPRLETITPENVEAACRLQLLPGQERFVAPVALSLAQAYAEPDFAWPRLIYEGDEIVAFVMAGFKPGDPLLDSTIWRLNVAGAAQRRGYGDFAVRAVAEEARRRGRDVLFTAYLRGKG